MSFLDQFKEAGDGLAKTAISSPGLFRQYHHWTSAKDALKQAHIDLERSGKAWLEVIEPALKDPLLKQLAERDGLIPGNDQGKRS